jgi:hypothetical protein
MNKGTALKVEIEITLWYADCMRNNSGIDYSQF